MKFLVMSDSHGRSDVVASIIKRHNVDRYIHCGDSEMPHPLEPLDMVKGNSYYDPALPLIRELHIEGHNILVTHGHLFQVQFGLLRLKLEAEERKCSIVFYGHTHRFLDQSINGIRFMNPGSITRSRFGVESYIIFDTMSNKCTRYDLSGEEIKDNE